MVRRDQDKALWAWVRLELAAAVALNDHLASLSLPPDNEGWFNAEKERKVAWKEEWKGTERV